MLSDYLKPSSLLRALDDLNTQAPSHNMDKHAALRRIVYTLTAIALSLVLVEYFKHSSSFRSTIKFFEILGILPSEEESLLNSHYSKLLSYAWWSLWQFIAYIFVPMIFIKCILKDKISNYGWRWADTSSHWQGYSVVLFLMLIGVVVVSFSRTFSNFYPMYRLADRSWFDLLAWEFLYISQFICVEFFFRGFILHALRPAIGASSVFVMCVPYMMIHFTKPMFESFVAFGFGLFAAILALRSRSIWGGVLVHVCIALLMDIMAIIQRDSLPGNFWPINTTQIFQ